MTAKVVLAEDLTLLRSGVRALLETSGKVQIVGEAADGREAIKLAQKLTPDVVLMDVAMPEMNGIEATRQIRKAYPQVRVMMLSMHADRQYIFESLRAGASGYVLKNAAPTELLSAIFTVMSGGTFLSSTLADVVLDDYLRRARGQQPESDVERLSGREREVLQLLAEGNSSSEIARRLHISTAHGGHAPAAHHGKARHPLHRRAHAVCDPAWAFFFVGNISKNTYIFGAFLASCNSVKVLISALPRSRSNILWIAHTHGMLGSSRFRVCLAVPEFIPAVNLAESRGPSASHAVAT